MSSTSGTTPKCNKDAEQLPTSTKTKLKTVTGDGSFQQLMKERTKIRKEKDEHSIAELRIQISSMDDALSTEIKRRIEMNTSVKSYCDDRISALQSRVEQMNEEKTTSTSKRLDCLEKSVDNLNKKVEGFLVDAPNEIERKGKELEEMVSKFKEELEQEKKERIKRDGLISNQIDEFRRMMENDLKKEREERERDVKELREIIYRNERERKEADGNFEKLIETELNHLKKEVESEIKERKMEDDEIIEALNRYTENLQASLSMISSLEE